MEIRFVFIARTQRTFVNLEGWEGVGIIVEPVWVIDKPMPLPIMVTSEPA